MNNKLMGLLVLCTSFFSCGTSWGMQVSEDFIALKNEHAEIATNITEQLAELNIKQYEILRDVKKQAGGDSTIAYRIGLKQRQPELDEIRCKIKALKSIQAKL